MNKWAATQHTHTQKQQYSSEVLLLIHIRWKKPCLDFGFVVQQCIFLSVLMWKICVLFQKALGFFCAALRQYLFLNKNKVQSSICFITTYAKFLGWESWIGLFYHKHPTVTQLCKYLSQYLVFEYSIHPFLSLTLFFDLGSLEICQC